VRAVPVFEMELTLLAPELVTVMARKMTEEPGGLKLGVVEVDELEATLTTVEEASRARGI
jgi:hypothetical protein